LTWQLTQEFPVRLWDAKKQLKELEAQIGETRERDAALGKRSRRAGALRKVRHARPGTGRAHSRADSACGRPDAPQKHFCAGMAVAELQHQKDQLAAYATQARFAVARIYDRQRREGSGSCGRH